MYGATLNLSPEQPEFLHELDFKLALEDWCCSVAQLCPTLCDPWTAAHQAHLSFTISRSSLRLMSAESLMPSNHLVLSRPLLLLPSVFPSIRVFSNEKGNISSIVYMLDTRKLQSVPSSSQIKILFWGKERVRQIETVALKPMHFHV